MAIYINNPETEKAIRELAASEGVTITDAIMNAVDEKLVALKKQQIPTGREGLAEKLDELAKSCKLIPGTEHLTDDEILGYNEDGIWD